MTFNHAMLYSRNVGLSLTFYADLLGFKLLDEFRAGDMIFYARLKSPRGNSTIAIHMLERGQELHTGGVRLYFEVPELARFCKRLEKAGAKFKQLPKKMPWGWTHAYLDDPDGHEVSLYWAGKKRLARAAKK